jgi:hypothetical protein
MEGVNLGRTEQRRIGHQHESTGPPRTRGYATYVGNIRSGFICRLLIPLSYRQLHTARPPLSDVPAIYFVSPTSLNIRRIAQDISQGLYSTYHLSFTSSLPKPLMEEFASSLLSYDPSGALADNVAGVWDQNLDFIVPSQSLFSLLPRKVPAQDTSAVVSQQGGKRKDLVPAPKEIDAPASYTILNSPSATETEIEAESERIARGLFSVVVTMGSIPIIRAPRGNAAEMVARKLDAKLREWATAGGNGARGYGLGVDGLSGLNRPRKYLVH